MIFKKVTAGHYASEDGLYSVQKDNTGYVTIDERDGFGVNCGCDDDGWCAVFGEDVLDWYDTKKQAVAACEEDLNRKIGRALNAFFGR